jgi:pilus assembly protein Flp/PilA
MSLLAKFLKDEVGATAIEYGLIAAGISVAIIATVQGLGTKLTSTFTTVRTRSTNLERSDCFEREAALVGGLFLTSKLSRSTRCVPTPRSDHRQRASHP